MSTEVSAKVVKPLQHFEFAVLDATRNLGENAFPAEIARQLSKKLSRHVAIAQVFISLERMEDRGLVSSRDSDPEPVKGGRRRRIFHVEASGIQALDKTTATFRTTTAVQKESDYEEAVPYPA